MLPKSSLPNNCYGRKNLIILSDLFEGRYLVSLQLCCLDTSLTLGIWVSCFVLPRIAYEYPRAPRSVKKGQRDAEIIRRKLG